ncbi:MAG: restriction endonuclease subunit M, partial [Candidatus Electrothrix sp. LOE2]|nr:restriction endonuclease subunit M [Candidatus Electrothrix sp. LOE2]
VRGGVYYTPDYIVDYIVKNTVGKLVEGKRPGPKGGVRNLKILDPACGSGSFLIGAYQFLLDWHRDEYINDGPENWSKGKTPRIYQSQKGEWRLTTDERKRILLNNIYGVDIDHQAVEVTKLSLLLKVLEGEDEQSIGKQMSWFQKRVLPDLSNNIKCGNSLIGPDFYDHQQLNLFDDEEIYRVNAFDWNAEFSEIMNDGGFDVVIGNPPWGATFSKPEQYYLYENFDSARGKNIDSYAVFAESALTKMLKFHGTLSFIVPDTFLRKGDYIQLRRLFLEKSTIEELIETGPVFSKVRDTWCLVFCLINRKPLEDNKIRHKKISRFVVSVEERLRKFGLGEWDVQNATSQCLWIKCPEMIIGYLTSEEAQRIITKVELYPRLIDLADKYYISRGEEGSKYALKEDAKGDLNIVIPKDVNRYFVENGIKISSNNLTPQKIEAIYKHPKIWIIRIQKMRWKQRIVCSLDQRNNSAGMKTLQAIVSSTDDLENLKYLQGILASHLINFWCINYLADDMNKSYLLQLPIRPINFDDPADITRHNQMVSLVDQMLELNKKLAESKMPQATEMLKRQIESTDKQIDDLVYKLYDLTDEEIKIIESET